MPATVKLPSFTPKQLLTWDKMDVSAADEALRDAVKMIVHGINEMEEIQKARSAKLRARAASGGTARARSLSPTKKKAIARRAAKARWSK